MSCNAMKVCIRIKLKLTWLDEEWKCASLSGQIVFWGGAKHYDDYDDVNAWISGAKATDLRASRMNRNMIGWMDAVI